MYSLTPAFDITEDLAVIRGGGSDLRNVMVALMSAVVIGLLLLPSGASALTTMVVQDSVGDVGIAIDMKTGTIRDTLSPNVPLVKAGYFDMVSVWLSEKGRPTRSGWNWTWLFRRRARGCPIKYDSRNGSCGLTRYRILSIQPRRWA
jgi:hypothetical protein